MVTAQQEGFAQSIYSGMNQSDAYRANYDCSNMLPATIWARASELAADGKVAGRLADLRDTVTEANLWTRKEAFKEAEENLTGAREAKQWGPANAATKTRIELAGLVEVPSGGPETMLDAVLKIAAAMTETALRAQAGVVDGKSEVIEE